MERQLQAKEHYHVVFVEIEETISKQPASSNLSSVWRMAKL